MANQIDIPKTRVLTAKGVAKVLTLALGEEEPALLQNLVEALWHAERRVAEDEQLPKTAEWVGDLAEAIESYGS
jgi:hypothetical protein